jgi:D-glycero-alpha-D-manno-heptose-7-phosphate kinase
MIISKTPYRLSLFGGGTDYPAWYKTRPSKVISAAMAHYCYISLKKLPPYFDYVNRVIYSKIESVSDISQIDHPSVRECLKYYDIPNGISVSHDGDLPARSGIGSSSSFTVGLIHAITTSLGKVYTPYGLASDAIDIEQNCIGESVGVQDQIMAAYGGIRVIELSGENINVRDLRIKDDYTLDLEEHIMLGFSGIDRFSSIHAKQQIDAIKEGKSKKLLEEIVTITDTALHIFESHGKIKDIGELLKYQWSRKRQLTDTVTNDYIDTIYNKAINAGAYGGKLMGAGGGGFFMFLAPPDAHEKIKQAIPEINVWVPFKFDYEGSQIILES